MDLGETICSYTHWIALAQDRDQCECGNESLKNLQFSPCHFPGMHQSKFLFCIKEHGLIRLAPDIFLISL
jgi:hypothetical protein